MSSNTTFLLVTRYISFPLVISFISLLKYLLLVIKYIYIFICVYICVYSLFNNIPLSYLFTHSLTLSLSQSLTLSLSLDSEVINLVVSAFTKSKITSGEALMIENQLDDGSMYIVDHGSFDIFRKEKDKIRPGLVATIEKGCIVGEKSKLESKPRNASIHCVEDGLLWKLDGKHYEALIKYVYYESSSRIVSILQKVQTNE